VADQSPPHPYIPDGPVEASPGGFWGFVVRRAALNAVLDGVDLGAYDKRLIEWLLGMDDPTIRTLASLMWRLRLAGHAEDADPARTCRHCKQPIEACPHAGPHPWPVCKGWRHQGFPGQPVGAHHCGARSINPLAEPEAPPGTEKTDAF
jgi:hypothetical protein